MTTTTEKNRSQISDAEKKTFLEKRLQRKRDGATKPFPTIPRRAQVSPAPLSYGQEGMWYAEQWQPDTPTYNMPFAWRLHGFFNLEAFQQSLDVIGQRHEILRTGFQMINGQPGQVIAAEIKLPLQTIDLQHLPGPEREAQALALVNEEARRPFDLAQAPLLRAKVIHLAPAEYILMLTLHHIAGDAWSARILQQELSLLYAAFTAGQPTPRLANLPLQYADFALWQRAQLAGQELKAQLAYWRQQLAGAPPVLEFPTDYTRPAQPSRQGEKVSLTLPRSLQQALKILSNEAGVTMFMTLLTGFKLLLHRYTRQHDIVVGTPMINRSPVELEHLLGYFLNILVLRTDLAGDLTFRDLLARVRQVTLNAYTHRDFPFERLVQELQPERDPSYSPLFQIFFNMVNASEEKFKLAGLTVTSLSRAEIENGSKFDMTLYAREHGDHIDFHLAYKSDLFRRERMVELLAQYEHLLAQIVSNPDQKLVDYSLVTPAARPVLPDPTRPLPRPPQPLVTSLVAAWANRVPQQIAISQGGRTWTYGELVARAETLARTLHKQGLTPGDTVAIYARRSFGLIAGMLGVLAGGGVFLLIDPTLPDERKLVMLREANTKWLVEIVVDRCPADWPGQTGLPLVQLEASNGQVMPEPATDLAGITLPQVRPEDPAYIFFTSGTTGQPKGILGSQQGLSHFVGWQGATFDVEPDDRVAQLIGPAFDAILRDIFLPLTHGATLCLPDTVDSLSPVELLAWFKRERITLIHTVPALAQTWLAQANADLGSAHLRWTFFSGEPLTDTLVRQWQTVFPNSQVVNLYGPTETTMVKFYYQVSAEVQSGVQPAGRPMPQTEALVMTANGRLCGLNEPGEIVIRTPFRTLGYINAPEEQEKRFRPNPFRQDSNDLLYYTGDLGCYQPDGSLVILGRLDDQVKVRGVRVELGEIIATLAQHPALQACTVIAQKDAQGQNDLVAYVVPKAGHMPGVSDLRAYLAQKLMPAMVPGAFVTLDQLPLLPTGKVDRRQLPRPELSRVIVESDFVAPRTPTEEILAKIWLNLLGLEQVGVQDNFFELGGHSLLALQLLSQIEQTTGRKVSLALLFQAPTIAQLARTLDSQQLIDPATSLIAMRSGGTKPPVFCLPGNLGNVFTDLSDLVRYLHPDHPCYGLQDGPDNPAKIEDLAAHYLAEVRRVQPQGPYFLLGICSGGMVAFEMAQQLYAQAQAVALLALVEPSLLFPSKMKGYLSIARFVVNRVLNRLTDYEGSLSQLRFVEQRNYVQLKQKLIANTVAARSYEVRLYPGRLDLFLTGETMKTPNNYRDTWQHWAAETVLHELPGNHQTITGTYLKVEAAHMKVLAEKLNKRLDELDQHDAHL